MMRLPTGAGRFGPFVEGRSSMNTSMTTRLTNGLLSLRVIGAVILVVTFALAWTHQSGPLCLWRTLFNVPCPGCGLTRSVEAIWHGHLLLSFRYHPLGIPLFIACFIAVFHRKNEKVSAALNRYQLRIALSVAALMLLIWSMRLALAKSGNTFFLW